MAIFLLLGIGIYLSLVIFFTFEILFVTGLVYLMLIPISYIQYKKQAKNSNIKDNDEETEDIL
jgi:hypothetical protein